MIVMQGVFDSFDLTKHVAGPTHHDRYTLDLVITRASENGIITNNCVRQRISDHFAVHCNLALAKPPLERKTISLPKTRSIDFDKLRDELSNCSLILDPSPDLDEVVEQFNTTLSKLVDVYAPVKTKPSLFAPSFHGILTRSLEKNVREVH